MAEDVRLCFIGDSFVAGTGDPDHRGWVGRLLADPFPGVSLTGYNLGIRGNTSSDVLTRWRAEVTRRLHSSPRRGLVVSFGVNDTSPSHRPTHPVEQSAAHLDQLLTEARAAGHPVLVVGPPPVADQDHNRRIIELDRAYTALCARRGARYVPVVSSLLHSAAWGQEVAAGDGAHPGAAGYMRLADLLCPAWHNWLHHLVEGATAPRENRR